MSNLWKLLADGGETRQVSRMNNHDTPAVSIGKEVAERVGVEIGDTVAVEADEENRTVTIYCGPGDHDE